jgi:hypothetical protein
MAATDEPDPTAAARQTQLRKVIADFDGSVGQYRRLLEAGGDPVDVARWLGAAKAQRSQAERELADLASHRPITAAEIEVLLAQVPDKLAMLTGPTRRPGHGSIASWASASPTTPTKTGRHG